MMIKIAELKDIKGIAKVHVDSWKTTYAGIAPDSYLDDLKYEDRENLWKRVIEAGYEKSCLYIAENEEGDIIGFANGGPERTNYFESAGELYAIYILKEYQGCGIGSNLIKKVANDLLGKGYQSMLVWVLLDNPSRKFYEALNPEKIDTEEITIGGKPLLEIAYGWKELKALI